MRASWAFHGTDAVPQLRCGFVVFPGYGAVQLLPKRGAVPSIFDGPGYGIGQTAAVSYGRSIGNRTVHAAFRLEQVRGEKVAAAEAAKQALCGEFLEGCTAKGTIPDDGGRVRSSRFRIDGGKVLYKALDKLGLPWVSAA
jgi:hypothetical protein